jgi:hypothetical protein
MKDIYAEMGRHVRETTVANTSRTAGQAMETTSNKQPVPRGVPAIAKPEKGDSIPDWRPPVENVMPRRVGKHPALGAPYVLEGNPTGSSRLRDRMVGDNDGTKFTGVVGAHPMFPAGRQPGASYVVIDASDPPEDTGTGEVIPGGVKVR